MMKTGTIVKIDSSYAVVLSDEGKPEKVHYKSDMSVGQKIYYFRGDIYTMKSKMIKISALVASLLVVVLVASLLNFGGNVDKAYANTYAIVTVDINPSVEIQLDEESNVIEVTDLNNDATNIITDDMLGVSIEDAIEILLGNAQAEGYLLDQGSILISSVVLEIPENDTAEEDEDTTEENEDSLEARLQVFMEKKTEQYNFLYAKGTEDAFRAAKSQGLSLGKYEMLKFLDEDITKEQIKEMKVSAIAERKEIKALSKLEKKALKIISKENLKETDEDELEDAEKVTFDDDSETEDATTTLTTNTTDLNNSVKKNNPSSEKEIKEKEKEAKEIKEKVVKDQVVNNSSAKDKEVSADKNIKPIDEKEDKTEKNNGKSDIITPIIDNSSDKNTEKNDSKSESKRDTDTKEKSNSNSTKTNPSKKK